MNAHLLLVALEFQCARTIKVPTRARVRKGSFLWEWHVLVWIPLFRSF